MTHAQRASELFMMGANCSQAVFTAFADVTRLDADTACRLATAFGGGLGRQRELCGAVSGMTMVLGALYGYTDVADQAKKGEVYALEQELCGKFRERFGTMNCGELLEPHVIDVTKTPMPDARTAEYYKTRPCVAIVVAAAEILDEFIAAHPTTR